MRPSSTASRWPAMSVATAGVPQAPASVRVMPHPSRWRGRGHDPGPPVPVERPRRRRPDRGGRSSPRPRDGAAAPRGRGARSPRRRSPPAGRARGLRTSHQRLDQQVEPLDRHQATDRHHEGLRRAARRPGEKRGSTPGGATVTRSGREAEHARRSRRVTTARASPPGCRGRAVGRPGSRRRLAHPGQPGGQHHPPHLGVHVVQEDDPRPPVPQGREERHAVPHLDQPLAGPPAGGAAPSARRRAGNTA